jgi:predicted transcriptional regulator
MGTVVNQDARDKTLWDAWVEGTRQVELAEAHGITQGAVSQAINRYRATIPIEDKATAFVRDLERLESLVAVYLPMAKAKDKDAAKLVKDLVAQEARMLGLEAPRMVDAIISTAQAGTHVSGRLAEVHARNAARLARVPGELVRLDERRAETETWAKPNGNGHGAYNHDQTEESAP